MTRTRGGILSAALIVLLASCSSSPDREAGGDEVDVVTATLSDEMRIDLSRTSFTRGETVRFEVTNTGAIRHEMLLGDEEAQRQFAEEMAGMEGGGHDGANGVSVEPGDTETFEFTFEQSGEILAGCHEPGHYEAGMVVPLSTTDG